MTVLNYILKLSPLVLCVILLTCCKSTDIQRPIGHPTIAQAWVSFYDTNSDLLWKQTLISSSGEWSGKMTFTTDSSRYCSGVIDSSIEELLVAIEKYAQQKCNYWTLKELHLPPNSAQRFLNIYGTEEQFWVINFQYTDGSYSRFVNSLPSTAARRCMSKRRILEMNDLYRSIQRQFRWEECDG